MENFSESENRREKRAELVEKHYKNLLENELEYAFEPYGELTVDNSDKTIKAKIENKWDSKLKAVSDLLPGVIWNDEELLVLYIEGEIFMHLTDDGRISFEELKDGVKNDPIGMEWASSESLVEYALRRAWSESKNIVENL